MSVAVAILRSQTRMIETDEIRARTPVCPAVCAVREPASGRHPFAPATHSLSSTLTLPAFSSWVPMATPVSPYHSSLYPPPPPTSLSQAALVSFHSQTLPYINTKHNCSLFFFPSFFLFTLYVCHCVCVCACVRLSLSTVGGHSKFRLIKIDYFRSAAVSSRQNENKYFEFSARRSKAAVCGLREDAARASFIAI